MSTLRTSGSGEEKTGKHSAARKNCSRESAVYKITSFGVDRDLFQPPFVKYSIWTFLVFPKEYHDRASTQKPKQKDMHICWHPAVEQSKRLTVAVGYWL